jgi:hypothetical protein
MTDFESTNDTTAEATESNESGRRHNTVQGYRHEAKRGLSKARETLSFRTEETKEVYSMINGTISSILAGRQGFTQEQQVEHLDNALAKVKEAQENLPEKIAAARESVIAALDNMETRILSEVATAAEVLTEAREFAATRDFAAHQERKQRNKYGSGYSGVTDFADDADDYEEDPDF